MDNKVFMGICALTALSGVLLGMVVSNKKHNKIMQEQSEELNNSLNNIIKEFGSQPK